MSPPKASLPINWAYRLVTAWGVIEHITVIEQRENGRNGVSPLCSAPADFRLRDVQGNLFSGDIQVHTLELTKLTATRENLVQATAAQRWAYFLRNAESMTAVEIRELFPDPEFVEAAGVLEMINQTPEQLEQYRARMKFRMDEVAKLDYARLEGEKKGREEGLQEGEEKGALLGRIALCQELLNISEPSPKELSACDLSQLAAYVKQFQEQLRNRGH